MVKIIFGGAGLSDERYFNTPEKRSEVIDILLANNVTNIDSARLYSGSEVAIGQLEKKSQFTIDTKLVGGFGEDPLTRESIAADVKDSLQRVGIPQFDILYIHSPPNDSVNTEEFVAGINEAYKSGAFRRFGLSNFSATQVQTVYDVAKKNGYVLPSVYQGNYNPVARHLEDILFPTLKKLNIKFYAYSPLAGGFLTKTAADLDAGAGRFHQNAIGGLYKTLYDHPSLRAALLKWNAIADKEGVSNAELAYRWVKEHSWLAADDENGVIFGASKAAQVGETAGWLKKGKLSEEAVKGIEEIWESVKGEAPVDNFNKFSK